MSVYAVKSEPFDSSDGEWPSTAFHMSYNGMSLQVEVTYDGDKSEDEHGLAATKGLAILIYSKMLGEGF
jgi:hypothetical protein